MTLKRSFLGSMLENLKRRRATIALTIVTLLLGYPIIFLLTLSSVLDNVPDNRRIEAVISYAGSYFVYNQLVSIMFGALGVILAFQAFGFLHKKNKMDLYNSVPVSYNRRFLTIVINSILILLVSTLACFVLCLIIMGSYRVFDVNLALRLLSVMSTGVLFGIGMFSITALAICLTGNTVVAVCGTVVLALYEIAVCILLRGYMERFFLTYTSQSLRGFSLVIPKFSIIYYMTEIMNAGEVYSYMYWQSGIDLNVSSSEGHTIFFSLTMIFVITLVTLLLTWLCFKKRPSEAAGKSMAFQKTKRVIKYLIMIFATLAGAELFRATDSGETFLIFGGVLTAVMGCMMIEIIYEGDIRSALKHLVDIPAVLAVAAIIFGIFFNDIFGYDSYVPEKASLKKVSFASDNLRYRGERFMVGKGGKLSFADNDEYMLNCYFDDEESMDVILNAAKNHVSNNEYYSSQLITVKYVLKNGQVKYRRYGLPQNSYEEMADVWESREDLVKLSFEGLYELRDYVRKISILDISGNWKEVPDEDVADILDAYTKDAEKIKSLADLREKKTIGTVALGIGMDDSIFYEESYRYPIFDDFDNTIACLENKGHFYVDYLKNRKIESVSIYQFKIGGDGNFMCDDREASAEEGTERRIFINSDLSIFGTYQPVYNRKWFLSTERENEIREITGFGFSGYMIRSSNEYILSFYGEVESEELYFMAEKDDYSENNVRYLVIIDWKDQDGVLHTDEFSTMPRNIGRLEEIIRLYGKEEF